MITKEKMALYEAEREERGAVKELCKKYGIRQVDLSREFGIPSRTVEDWFAGRRKPQGYVVKMLEELLEVRANERKDV